VIGASWANREYVQIGRQSARPRIFKGELGGHRLIESSGRGREHHAQIVVIAHAWRTDILNPFVYDRAAAHGGEVPGQWTRSAANGAAGGRCGLRPRNTWVSQRKHAAQSNKKNRNRNPQNKPDAFHEEASDGIFGRVL
jgi:hypothetical protein